MHRMTTYDPADIIARVLPLPKRRRWSFLNQLEYLQYRFVAFILDLIAIGYLLLAWNFFATRIDSLDALTLRFSAAVALLIVIEVAALWGTLSTSLGARVMDLRLRATDGGDSTLQQRLVRFLAWNLSFIVVMLGHLWALGDAAWLTWADRLSGTIVVAQEKREGTKRAKPGGWYASSSGLVILALLALTYATGWLTTEVRIGPLFRDVDSVQPLVRDLLSPEIFAREQRSIRLAEPIFVPCPENPPPVPERGDDPVVIPSVTCGEFGQQIIVEAFNLQPETAVRLVWLDASGVSKTMVRTETDSEGHLRGRMVTVEDIANSGPGQYGVEIRQEWEVGSRRLSETFSQVVGRMVETIFMALMATTLGVIFAVPISFLAARNLMARNPLGTVIYYLVRLVMNILRAIEPLIWAIIFVVWVGIGPFAGTLALFLHTVAALGKLYSEAVESIDPGPIEAITATGANRLQTIVFAVIPQVVPPFIAFTIYRWDINVRMSTVIGFVGGGGIGFLLIQWINLFQYRQAAVAVWAIAIVVAVMDYVSAIVRERVV